MENFIMMIILINVKLDGLTQRLERRIETLAATPAAYTARTVDYIIELDDKRRRLINLRVLNDAFLNCLGLLDYMILKYYSSGMSYAEIAEKTGIGKLKLLRRVNQSFETLKRLLLSYGFGKDRLAEEYGKMTVIQKYLDKCRSYRRRRSASPTEIKDHRFLCAFSNGQGIFTPMQERCAAE